jgi:hypothetical protein
VHDDHEYEDRDISGEEFRNLRDGAREDYFEVLRPSKEES